MLLVAVSLFEKTVTFYCFFFFHWVLSDCSLFEREKVQMRYDEQLDSSSFTWVGYHSLERVNMEQIEVLIHIIICK